MTRQNETFVNDESVSKEKFWLLKCLFEIVGELLICLDRVTRGRRRTRVGYVSRATDKIASNEGMRMEIITGNNHG